MGIMDLTEEEMKNKVEQDPTYFHPERLEIARNNNHSLQNFFKKRGISLSDLNQSNNQNIAGDDFLKPLKLSK